MVFQNDIIAGSSGGSGTSATYSIDQSIRFNPADSTYMSRAVGSGGNTKTWTFSCWFKIGVLGSQRSVSPFLWSCHQSDGNRLQLSFDSGTLGNAGDYLSIYDGASASTIFRTNRVFRDSSAWYNLVLVADTSNAVSSERFRVYVNGQRETSFSTFNAPSLNADLGWNQNGSTYYLGSYFASQGTYAFDGYIAEMVHIDGTALEPSNFAETNSNGIWIPKDVSGLTFGTKGFYIDGRDSSDLGDDESGNGNDFTTSGLASHDQVADSPTNNFCTINSVYADATGANNLTLSEGNLEATGSSSSFSMRGFTFNVPKSGKWYMEYTIGGGYDGFGFCVVGQEGTITPSGNGLGQLSVAQGGGIQYNGWRNGGSLTVTMATFTSGHIHQIAIDVDNGKFYYGIQNTYYAADGGTDGNPSAGTNHTSTFDFAGNDVVLMTAVTTDSNPEHWNFGQNGTFNGTVTAGGNSDGNGIGNFKYSVPTGYLALCSKNVGS